MQSPVTGKVMAKYHLSLALIPLDLRIWDYWVAEKPTLYNKRFIKKLQPLIFCRLRRRYLRILRFIFAAGAAADFGVAGHVPFPLIQQLGANARRRPFLPLARRDAAERGAGMSLMPRRAVTFACAKVTKTPAWGYRPLRTPFSCAVRIVIPIKIHSPLSRLSGEVELPVPDCGAYRSCWRLARP